MSEGACTECGDVTELDEDLLCAECTERLINEDEDDENPESGNDFAEGDPRLFWTRDQHIRGEP